MSDTLQAILAANQMRERRLAKRQKSLRDIGMLQARLGEDPTDTLRAARVDPTELAALQSIAKTIKKQQRQAEQQGQQKAELGRVRQSGQLEGLSSELARGGPDARRGVVGLLRQFEGPGGVVGPGGERAVRELNALVPLARAQQRNAPQELVGTEDERIIAAAKRGELGPEAQQFVNSPEFGARLAASTLGGGGLRLTVGPDGSINFEQGSTGALSGFRQNRLVSEAQGNANSRRLIRSMISTIEATPSAEGFAALASNAAARGLGIIEGADRFLGTNLNQFVGSGRLEAMANGQIPASPKVRSTARSVLSRVRANEVGSLEVQQELLTLALADALRPAESRVTNQLFERVEKLINFKDTRANTVTRLRELDKQLAQRSKDIQQRAKRSDVELPVFDIAPLPPLGGAAGGAAGRPKLKENQVRLPDGSVIELRP